MEDGELKREGQTYSNETAQHKIWRGYCDNCNNIYIKLSITDMHVLRISQVCYSVNSIITFCTANLITCNLISQEDICANTTLFLSIVQNDTRSYAIVCIKREQARCQRSKTSYFKIPAHRVRHFVVLLVVSDPIS